MPTEGKNPNRQQEVMDKITKIGDNLGNTSFRGVNELISITNQGQLDAVGLLRKLTEDVDNQVFKTLASDMINVLGSFYGSEEVLCCLIKNLLLAAKAGDHIKAWKDKAKKFKENLTGEEEDLSEEFSLSVNDLSFVKMIDEMIFVVDTVIIFLSLDMEDFVIPALDFSKTLSEAIVGMVVIAMQEIVFTLRDTSIAWIVEELSKNVGGENWVKCLPFMDFVRILRRYIHDHGLLDRLFKLISGHIGAKYKIFKGYQQSDFVNNVKMIEFLKWLRDILVKMKNASISWEFCVDLNFDFDTNKDKSQTDNAYDDYVTNPDYTQVTTGDPENNLNVTLGDNNTILTNTGEPILDPNKIGNFHPPSNSEVNSFLTKFLGLPKDLADQITGMTDNTKNIQGSLSSDPHSTNNDCGFILSQDNIKNAINSIIKGNGLS